MTAQNQNLLWRVVTALVGLPLVVWLIVLGGWPFAILLALAAGLGAREFYGMALGEKNSAAAAIGAIAAALLPIAALLAWQAFSIAAVASIAVIAFFIERLLAIDHEDAEALRDAPRRVALGLFGCLYPGLLLSTLVLLRAKGPFWVVLALTATWANDTGAYFAGRAFGRVKLYPKISPAKTWEGAVGGLLAAVAGALVVQHFWLVAELPVAMAVLIGAGASVLGPLGDLSESMLKRAFGAKDSSHLLPGHGGVLDRVDALLFVAPFVLLVANLL